MKQSEAERYRRYINTVIENLDDAVAIEVVDLFPEWDVGIQFYGPGDPDHPQSRVRFGKDINGKDLLYKCNITHISQADWTPDVAVSLWSKIDDPAEEWPEWRQPTGAHDSYDVGRKVSHKGKHYINTVPANTREPGSSWDDGWDEVPIETA